MKDWLKDIKVVGFDLDGTLYPPGTIPLEIIDKEKIKIVANTNGWDLSSARREYEKILLQLGSHTKTLTALGVPGTEFFLRMWDSLALDNYIKKDTRVVEMLENLVKVGKSLFVLSNSNREDQIERKLRLIGIDPTIFKFLQTTVGMETVKPDPRPFMTVIDRLGLDAEEILYVGDREETDIKGATNVGMKTCMVWGASELADKSFPTVYGVSELFD